MQSVYWGCLMITLCQMGRELQHHFGFFFRPWMKLKNAGKEYCSLADSPAMGAVASPGLLARLGLLPEAPVESWDMVCCDLPAPVHSVSYGSLIITLKIIFNSPRFPTHPLLHVENIGHFATLTTRKCKSLLIIFHHKSILFIFFFSVVSHWFTWVC